LSFKITILGSSGAVPAYGRLPSSQFIEIQNHCFLVDCGEGTQLQLTRYNLHFHRIDHIFITHLHGDHYLGLMGLLFTMHLNKRATDLHLYSHRGLDEIITLQLKYSNSALNFKIIFHTLTPSTQETILSTKTLTVETIPLDHKIPCSGFLFREKEKPRRIDKDKLPAGLSPTQLIALKNGDDVQDADGNILYKNEAYTLPPRRSRSYAYCSDTAYTESLLSQINNVNLLYHEASFMDEDKGKAEETRHSTATQAAQIARLASVDKLIIGHFSARYRELDALHQQAKKIFMNTALAQEGESFVIEE
jgi:ribonuclease Z